VIVKVAPDLAVQCVEGNSVEELHAVAMSDEEQETQLVEAPLVGIKREHSRLEDSADSASRTASRSGSTALSLQEVMD